MAANSSSPKRSTHHHSRPYIVVRSTLIRTVFIIELTVPVEEEVDATYERKRAEYSELAAECRVAGWRAVIYPVEVRCLGFICSS